MRATEMHDLLHDVRTHIDQSPIWRKGRWPGFQEIKYSAEWIDKNGHDEDCLYGRLKRATDSAEEGRT
jgi:hypothetical protein